MKNTNLSIEEYNTQTRIKDKLAYIIKFALLAPSSHNIQPWLFKLNEEDSTIIVIPNLSVRLPKSDPKDRQLYLSIGAAIGNIKTFLEEAKIKFDLDYVQNKDYIETKIKIQDIQSTSSNTSLIKAIFNRHNNRSNFSSEIPKKEVLNTLSSFFQKEVFLNLIQDSNKVKNLALIAANSVEEAFLNKGFTNELSNWIKPSLKKFKDGLVAYNIEIPFLVSFFIPFIVKNFNISKQQRKLVEEPLSHTQLIGVISSEQDDPKTWLKAGEAFERMWLYLESNNIKLGVYGSPIEIGDAPEKIKKILGTESRPLLFFRIGYSDKIPRSSPRKSIEDLLIQ